jgi:phosphoribosylformylglycinamidine cyclo-ligase
MFRTFNMGIGMVLVVSPGDAARTVALFGKLGLKAWIIGDVVRGEKEVVSSCHPFRFRSSKV